MQSTSNNIGTTAGTTIRLVVPLLFTQHIPTFRKHPDDSPLSAQQQQAILLVLRGLSDTAVAKRLGVDRKTIYRWKWQTPLFYNTLDEAQRQAWNEAYGLLRSSILRSAQKLSHIIKKGKPQDAIKAAKVLLSTPVLTRLEG